MYDSFLIGGFYLVSLAIFLRWLYQDYCTQRFSFHLLFSLIYLITFYAGMPFSVLMALGFDYKLPELSAQWQVFITAGGGYLLYYVCYKSLPSYQMGGKGEWRQFANDQAKITACLLAFLAISTLTYFLYLNGLLLFKLEKYSQLFSKQWVELAVLKRFFYFLLPALLIFFFIYQHKKAWWTLLVVGGAFGVLTYLAVGGTRANLALAFAFFFIIGWYKNYLSLFSITVASLISVVAMFFLALFRYKLDLSISETIYTFLYLSRDTFSPWENLSRLLSYEVEYQGLMPIVRDFYVYIPSILWQDRPDIVWNTANYFTKVILGNQSGLAISPTLLGSFYIMGGFWGVAIGMGLVSVIMKGFDYLFDYGKHRHAALIQAYCFGNLFNLIVLVREGVDAFVSRLLFFSVVFGLCWWIAKWILYRKQQWKKK